MKKHKKILLTKFYLAGYQYHKAGDVINQLKKGEKLHLEPEPENPFDRKALAIYFDENVKLGYVPQFYNGIPYRLVRQNVKLKLYVDKVNKNLPDYKKIKVSMYMEIKK